MNYVANVTAIIALVLATLSLPTAAHAGFKDGNELLEDCGAEKDGSTYYQSNAACMAFIIGVYDGIELENDMEKTKKLYCLYPNVRVGQLGDVVTKYLKDHPEQRHWPAAALVAIALKDAFPCDAKGSVK